VQPAPPFPYWPFSASSPKRILGMVFENAELSTLATFQRSINVRGQDYALLQENRGASLLLDIANASEPRLLREVVYDGVLFRSLWKVSDAYLESTGERRKQFRELLRHLFYWANCSLTHTNWPDHLRLRQQLFNGEGLLKSRRQSRQRAEALALSLEKVNRELRLFYVVARQSIRPSLLRVIRESQACVEDTASLKEKPKKFEHLFDSKLSKKNAAQEMDILTLKLVAHLKSALAFYQKVLPVLNPADAYRARLLIKESEAALHKVLPAPEHAPTHVFVGIILFDATLYLSRLFIGFWMIPIVWVLRHRNVSTPVSLPTALETPVS
jgi:hypothetical protein